MRLFIAMDVKDEDVKHNILEAQRELIKQGIDAKPVREDHLHFTLLFLGDVDDIMLDKIKHSLSDIRFKPIEVVYKGIGAFPSAKNARVIWVGVDERSSIGLKRIAEMIEDKLAPLGFKSDKEFTAHITILRVKGRVNIMSNNDIFGREVIDEIKVKKSELRAEGPIYSDLFSIHAC